MNDVDILSIDASIHKNFDNEQKKLSEHVERLEELKRSLDLDKLSHRVTKALKRSIEELMAKIDKIKSDADRNYYIIETASLLDEYRDIITKPIVVSFMGKRVRWDKEKIAVISKYLSIAQKYISINFTVPDKKNKVICNNCGSKDFDVVDSNTYVCENCSAQQYVLKHLSSYKDIDRVNMSSKYMYDRKVHFRDCINQYQGKQNSTIHKKVYDDLEDAFERHHLLIGDKNTPNNIRFSKITKEHINMFLQDLSYTKHYENVNLIHYNFTGKKPDDISYLEETLLNDFDELTALYDKRFKNIDRKNFINTQYVLFQLLSRHKHPCKKEDFTILKTIDRKSFHDDICRALFEEKGWNHVPYF